MATGLVLHFFGEFEAAAAECRDALDLSPDSAAAQWILAKTQLGQGKASAALELLQPLVSESCWTGALGDYGRALGLCGRSEEARALLETLTSGSASAESSSGRTLRINPDPRGDGARAAPRAAHDDRHENARSLRQPSRHPSPDTVSRRRTRNRRHWRRHCQRGGLSKYIAGLLYGVPAQDPWACLIVCSLLFLVALAAAYVPARRAMGLEPLSILRGE